ncbi:MAG: hypothetical protein QF464_17950 [Myxococcota bacterium]|nr:hypothetical protein [Myxococcota bacterium]
MSRRHIIHAIVSFGLLAAGCSGLPTDDDDAGEPVQSDAAIVQNALPTTPAAELTPLEGTVETLFTCTQTADSTDADDDALTYQTSWVVNGYENPGTTTTSVTADQVASDEAETPAKRGDTLSCRLRASDGVGLSQPAESNAVVLGNSPPTGGSVITGPPGAKEGDALTCEAAEAVDLDGDPIAWTIAWFVNDTEITDQTDATLTSDHFDAGDTVHCVATPSIAPWVTPDARAPG